MTAQQEIRFQCDRCGVQVSTLLQNTPLTQRMSPPDGWEAMTFGDQPATHLCPACAKAFREFMARR
jgi:hypothetical protein